MNQKQFTVEDLHELEELQVIGGKSPFCTMALVINDTAGCGAGDEFQHTCVNAIYMCGAPI